MLDTIDRLCLDHQIHVDEIHEYYLQTGLCFSPIGAIDGEELFAALL